MSANPSIKQHSLNGAMSSVGHEIRFKKLTIKMPEREAQKRVKKTKRKSLVESQHQKSPSTQRSTAQKWLKYQLYSINDQ